MRKFVFLGLGLLFINLSASAREVTLSDIKADSFFGEISKMTFLQAKKYCDNMDARLPTILELMEIQEFKNAEYALPLKDGARPSHLYNEVYAQNKKDILFYFNTRRGPAPEQLDHGLWSSSEYGSEQAYILKHSSGYPEILKKVENSLGTSSYTLFIMTARCVID